MACVAGRIPERTICGSRVGVFLCGDPRGNSRVALLLASIVIHSSKFNSTPHQSPGGFAARVHGFASKTEALAPEILPAT